jgi:Fic family protein
MIAILPLLQQDNSLHQQGTVFQNWLTTTFPEEFIYHSNHIEGSKIPKSEVANILQGKKLAYKVKNEVQEVKNSLQARTFLQSDFLWNIANIKKLYHILTKDLLQETGIFYPRGFKKVSIVVNNAATTDPQQVEKAVSDLLQMIKTQKKTLFPLQLAFDFHLKYEQIHPFENGNGRTGRFLMDKLLLQNGLLPMIVFKDNKEAYFNAIKKASES